VRSATKLLFFFHPLVLAKNFGDVADGFAFAIIAFLLLHAGVFTVAIINRSRKKLSLFILTIVLLLPIAFVNLALLINAPHPLTYLLLFITIILFKLMLDGLPVKKKQT
jgi:hypothetical protein